MSSKNMSNYMSFSRMLVMMIVEVGIPSVTPRLSLSDTLDDIELAWFVLSLLAGADRC
jgi:hypothetical protein